MASQNQKKRVLWESLKYKAATHSLFSDWKYCLVDTQKTVLFVWDILMNSSMIRATVQGLQPGCHALRRCRTYPQTCICTEVGKLGDTGLTAQTWQPVYAQLLRLLQACIYSLLSELEGGWFFSCTSCGFIWNSPCIYFCQPILHLRIDRIIKVGKDFQRSSRPTFCSKQS